MKRLCFDIETDGLLEEATVVHCMVAVDLDSRHVSTFRPGQEAEMVECLNEADVLYAHNGIDFDYQAMMKLTDWRPRKGVRYLDSLCLSRLVFSDLKERDYQEYPWLGSNLGSHSLEAWGQRLGNNKAKFNGDFREFSEEMLAYCEQDVMVLVDLVELINKEEISEEASRLEHRTAYEYSKMSRRGFRFDSEAAERLAEGINASLDAMQADIDALIPPVKEEMKTPQWWKIHWENGEESTFDTKTEAETERKRRKVKPKQCLLVRGPNKCVYHHFNANSDPQIRKYLVDKYNWVSPSLTETGEKLFKKAKTAAYEDYAKDYGSTGEKLLRASGFPEAQVFADVKMRKKCLSMVHSGPKAWVKFVRENGRIHARFVHIGTITHRAAASSPNLQQTPHVNSDRDDEILWGAEGRYGADCRALFLPSDGLMLVGVDLNAIESRMLAHFLHPYDGGAYAHVVMHGDIHNLNCEAFKTHAGYTISRGPSKTVFYAWCYSAGDEKLGRTVVSICEEAKAEFADLLHFHRQKNNEQKANFLAYKHVGGKIRNAFEQGIGGMGDLIKDVQKAASRGYLKPLDGRRVPVRKEHAALNTLLQSSAAIVFKRWLVTLADDIVRKQMGAYLLAPIHDEIQAEVKPEWVDPYKEAALASIVQTGEYYHLNLPLKGEAKSGMNWAMTH